jgi:DNA-binding transcriptional ArsR family regulator
MGLHLLQQSNISQHISSVEHLQVELLMLYGKSSDMEEGKHYTSLTRRGFKRLMKDICHIQHHLKSLRDIYLIDLKGEIVLSVGNKNDQVSSKKVGNRTRYLKRKLK